MASRRTVRVLARCAAAVLLAAGAAACDSTAPDPDVPTLIEARYAAAEPPADEAPHAAQVTFGDGVIEADVLLRADIACNTVGAGLGGTDTLLLVIETTTTTGCAPIAGGILVNAIVAGVPDAPPPFRIEWWHGAGVDTVWGM